MSPQPKKGLTVDDYMALEGEQRHELIRGRLLMTPSPALGHQHTTHEIDYALTSHVREFDLGHCFEAPTDVVLFEDTVLQPDFLFVAKDRLADLYDGHSLTGPPDLVVEVLSPGTIKRDRIEKMDLYGEAGVPWLLLVEPDERFVEVFRLEEDSGKYRRDDRASDDETLSFGLFPDLEIDLSDVWFDEPPQESD
jgi:Uma2 family endonuclease